MKTMRARIVSALLGLLVCAWPAHAQPGAEVLRSQGCLQCHGVGGIGPNLARRLVVDYTVPALAAAVWNHTPAMWTEMAGTVTMKPAPTDAQWEDLFRHLYTLQFSDRPALTRQGGTVFGAKCGGCHGVGNANPGPGKPVAEWTRLDDPIALVHQMWTHASSMKKEFKGPRAWQKLESRELADLTVYLQSVQQVPRNDQAALPKPAEGRLLSAEHCGTCHGGPDAFAALMHNKTLMDIGAATWNHVPLMDAVPALSRDDFKKIVAYVWELQYRGPNGVASVGERVFASKGCISCHRSPVPTETAQSPRPGKTFTPLSMVALSWGSGREMHRQMQGKGVRWPNLTSDDVSNLVAYLNTLGR